MGRLPLVKPWAGELHDDDLLAPAVIKAGAAHLSAPLLLRTAEDHKKTKEVAKTARKTGLERNPH